VSARRSTPAWFAAAACVAACGGRTERPPRAAKDAPTPVVVVDATAERCERLPFAATLPVPEASGSALMPIDGADALIVVGDSGNHGAYVIVDPVDGTERETGRLPLGTGGGDDLEGLAVRDGVLVGLTSAGWILAWQRDGHGFALVDGPYAVGDLASGLACDPKRVNCGKNYEGLCLRSGPIPDGECAGLAASKQDGALHCLVLRAGRLAVAPPAIPISAPETLTGCDLAPDGAVWAGTNLFGASRVYRIIDWTTPATTAARVEELEPLGDGFPESIAIGPAGAGAVLVYRFSDLGGTPSAVAKYRCRDGGR